MEITEVTLTLAPSNIEERDGILAFARVVLGDCFAVKDIKVMERDGNIFLGMPSRKFTDRCNKCGAKNAVTDKFCSNCGDFRQRSRMPAKIYQDLAYPINREYRRKFEQAVADQYNRQVTARKLEVRDG